MSTPPVEAPVGPPAAAGEYVLPKPGRGAGDLVVATAPTHRWHRDADVARGLGQRIATLAACQDQFLTELRSRLEDATDSVAEAGRARLQKTLQSALGVLEWCDAVQRELAEEADHANRGLQPIDLAASCSDLAMQWAGSNRTVHVRGDADRLWWGDMGRFAETVHAGLDLVAARCRDASTLVIEIDSAGGGDPDRDRQGPQLHIAGAGEPTSSVDPTIVRTFRQAAERLGARVWADALGPASTGFVLALPASPRD